MKRTRDAIRAALPWAILNKTATANRVLDALVCNGIVAAIACPAYACNSGWQYDGVCLDRVCPTCDGIGWLAHSSAEPDAARKAETPKGEDDAAIV